MKRIALIVFTLLAMFVLAPTAIGAPLEVVKCLVVTDQHGKSPDDLKVLMYLKNTQDAPIKLLTRNLQASLFLYEDRPKELHIEFSARKSFDGCLVVPSESDLSPVTIGKDEVAEIRIPYHDRKDLEEVVLVYDMRNDIAKRYGAWYGSISGKPVKVMKFDRKR